MEVYNTLTRKKEPLEPLEGKKLNMFVCGPTVYDYVHIGNARTFVFFDVVAKYLKHKYGDENVRYIQNITDIDNKIIERAEKEGVDPLEYAKKYTDIFKEDMKALSVTSPEYKNATDHIPEVIKQVQTLLDKGKAYVIENDGIYFDLSTFPDYGKLSGRTALMADDAVSRIDDSDKKHNRGDFAVWKFSQKGDPSWPAPFGDGRPGWHIEDTAITEKYFGPQYDIHGGGQDLIFPHHEAEIAQQESASGLKPFVKYWIHVGFLVNKEEKMSKSKGNFETVRELLKKYPKEVLRFYLLSAHYGSPLEFGEDVLEASKQGIEKIRTWLGYMDLIINFGQTIADGARYDLESFETNLEKAMSDNFNTPSAMGRFFTIINSSNVDIQNKKLDANEAKKLKTWLITKSDIFGIIPKIVSILPLEIQNLSDQRQKLKEKNNYEEADKIRIQIEEMGYRVEDTIYGPLITLLHS
ncbi:MAG: Cysteinyl-tRNA ligase [Candidatus Curtissbacteria bacterium GW2011_GWA1_41_11]|uniref:Cysteine--tRNA ligase n=1 Tax=Candidatus Curtissbacteria bacterium GW2011_GWA1_41_11 TaxID=1618409 RepID=A0A0G0WL33_9BACT|nr:MAG: Cysteinyl-tRNA ligase [Candidatus Curtissbacteria bacterium GW2011_GWA1_41_11]